MAKRIYRVLVALFGVAIGCALVELINEIVRLVIGVGFSVLFRNWALILIYVVCSLICGIIFYILSPKIIDKFLHSMGNAENRLSKMPAMDIFFGVLGLILGLLVALLWSTLLNQIPIGWLSGILNTIVYLICGVLGWRIAIKRRSEWDRNGGFRRGGRHHKNGKEDVARPKVLDTSVIIDGRILDICNTGVIEGTLLVPNFVLRELQHIADSEDALKRNRGRRGLDILNKMQKELQQTVQIDQTDYEQIAEVDSKLIKLAHDIGGIVVTNDYNLNKVASVQNVSVFNINDLANAIKPIALPGEEMEVQVLKAGKEAGQGIGYLEDGTMIVVENGKRYIGELVQVVVTSVLQASAGRMIFVKVKD